mmetsp:Transcript_5053/g.10970  ORF Transcript_5053/g.10970 Transcript_5053/m.10970 type:complete len:348 (-) Transcript_5053:1543-2586(-)
MSLIPSNTRHAAGYGLQRAAVYAPRCVPAFTDPIHRRQATVCSASSASAAPASGPGILRIPPQQLAAGGLDPSQDGPQAQAAFASHLAQNFLSVDLDAYPGSIRVMNVDPPVLTVREFLSSEQCDALRQSAEASGRMAQSAVGGHNVQGRQDIRTSRTLAITSEVLREHPDLAGAIEALLERAHRLLPSTPRHAAGTAYFSKPAGPGQVTFELPQVAHYNPGQHFLTHEDAFPVDISKQKGYQRRATLLVYLNDVAEGGQTKFDLLGFGVQPKKGQALLFFPSFAWCTNDKRTLHTAVDAVDEKWIFQLWVSSGLPAPKPGQGGKVTLPPGLQPARRGQAGSKSKKR